MLHHFPTRFDLIKAAVPYLNHKRLEMFATRGEEVNRDAEYTRVGEGIDVYWAQLQTPVLVVFHELLVAARTDRRLEKVLLPELEEFNTRFYKA
jgi:hypothetical protein|tara:strand:+ start:1997 stop:2278 length:282 start_codon:yes stop_codon:yes gene_type:complete